MTESFVVLALPHTTDPASRMHVSLFVAPKLVPPAASTTLDSFAVFQQWAGAVRGARITLSDPLGDLECTPDLGPVDTKVWAALFPPATTPVKGNRVPDLDSRSFRSFDTKSVTELAKGVHAAGVLASPTSAPAVHRHPLTRPIKAISNTYRIEDERFDAADLERSGHQERPRILAEGKFTEELDNWIYRDGKPPEAFARGAGGLAHLYRKLHEARRFYERPETAARNEYQRTPNAEPTSLPPQLPEFHERCASAGDHPALLRALGLVIDLTVLDLDRLARAEWLSARIDGVGNAACLATRVRCRRTPDGALVTVAGTEDWQDGALTLGRRDRFEVLDVDADGSALKTERFLWSIPRMDQVASNGDDINAASPALRASGFTVARTGQSGTSKERISAQKKLETDLEAGTSPLLSTEDVTRGIRVEVWDDSVRKWHTLHGRISDYAVGRTRPAALQGVRGEGFTQGTAATETPGADDTAPVYVHEAMFGWEGWSLAAPRPGKRIRKATPAEIAADKPLHRTEVVEDTPTALTAPDDPTHPLAFQHTVASGTLPRLRFGRNYAFRAWQVDLAGNSRPHELDPIPTASLGGVVAAIRRPVREILADGAASASGLREYSVAAAATRGLAAEPAPAAADDDRLTDLVVSRRSLRDVRRGQVPAAELNAGRRLALDELAATAAADLSQPLVRNTAVTDAEAVGEMVRAHLGAFAIEGRLGERAVKALRTVTPLKPFLRWDPVPPPEIVPRRTFTEGESLRVLVIRSGVTQDKDTLALTVTPPRDYASQVKAAHPLVRATSERHLAPPKTTQMTCELHGMFDAGIGDSTPAVNQAKKLLAIAITEDGSFLDRTRASLTNPTQRIDQPGIQLVTSSAVPQAALKEWPPDDPDDRQPGVDYVDPGESLAPGQYVIHDTPNLTIPYLPDPLARGVSFVFPEAGQGRSIPFPYGGEGFTAAYRGDWPKPEPYRLVLTGAPRLGGDVEGRVVHLRLPAGDRQVVDVSSCLPKDQLDLLGPWRHVSAVFSAEPEAVEAAADGWFWWLSPGERLTLVHAVPRPLEVPRVTLLEVNRQEGETTARFYGGVDLHGPSTDRLTAEASWTEYVDELASPGPAQHSMSESGFSTPVKEFEDIALFHDHPAQFVVDEFGPAWQRPVSHQFADTRHRKVTYRFRASTRFREYFAPELLAPDPANPLDDGQSVVSRPVTVHVPSSAQPAAPVVHSVIPLFRWNLTTEPEQPMARRHIRQAGVRIYLERPWFSSGEGELLAVLLAPDESGDDFGPAQEDESGFPFVSKVGGDPVWVSSPVHTRAADVDLLENMLVQADLDDRPSPGRPATPVRLVQLRALGQAFDVRAAGYRPQYHPGRKLWYVDVALDPGSTQWSFLRLAVARYQPHSVPGCELSAPVRCNFVQLPPERTTSVSRTDSRHVRVVVSGPTGARNRLVQRDPAAVAENRTIVASVQRRDPLIMSDLGWTTVASQELTIRGVGSQPWELAWVGEIDAGEDIPVRRPLDPVDKAAGEAGWRVLVEEWERFPGDVPAPRDAGRFDRLQPVWEQRLVFADEVEL